MARLCRFCDSIQCRENFSHGLQLIRAVQSGRHSWPKWGPAKTRLLLSKHHTVFSQGDEADAVFFIQAGKIKLTIVSQQGKEGVLALLEPGAFFGESCLAGHVVFVWRPRPLLNKCPTPYALIKAP